MQELEKEEPSASLQNSRTQHATPGEVASISASKTALVLADRRLSGRLVLSIHLSAADLKCALPWLREYLKATPIRAVHVPCGRNAAIEGRLAASTTASASGKDDHRAALRVRAGLQRRLESTFERFKQEQSGTTAQVSEPAEFETTWKRRYSRP